LVKYEIYLSASRYFTRGFIETEYVDERASVALWYHMIINKITHQEFVEQYKKRLLNIHINKSMASDLVLSKFGDKHNKPAHLFWSWTGIILTFVAPIILLFVNWIYAILSFAIGLMVISASRKSAEQFVMQNMIEKEEFWNYTLLHGGAKITDINGNDIKSSWLEKMGDKYGKPNQ
jgi:hypothetical protein